MLEETITRSDLVHHMWMKGNLSWKLWAQQIPIYQTIRGLPDSVTTVVVLCARQFGKSYLGTLCAVEDCLQNPDTSVLIIGPTIKQTIDIVHQSIRKIAQDAPTGLIQRSKSESRWFIGSSELLIGGFDISNATRQRGKTLLKIYLEELVDSNPDQYAETIRSDLAPALTHSKNGKLVYLTTPPKLPDHPFITDTIPEAKLYGAFFSFTIDDNKQLSPDQYEACVRRCGGKDTIEFRREYLCEIVRDPSITVVPDFRADKHVGDFALPTHCFYQTAVDFGGVRDFTVALLHTYDFLSDTDLVLDERVFGPNTPTNKIIEGIREMEGKLPIRLRWIDAPPQMVDIDMNSQGFDARVPLKTDWLSAVNNMAVRFTQSKCLIAPKCKFLIQSLQSGTFNKSRNDFERTSSLGHCDGLAALMYGIRHMDRTNPYPAHQVPGGVTWAQNRGETISVPHVAKRVGIYK